MDSKHGHFSCVTKYYHFDFPLQPFKGIETVPSLSATRRQAVAIIGFQVTVFQLWNT